MYQRNAISCEFLNVPYKRSILVCRIKVEKEERFGVYIIRDIGSLNLPGKDCRFSKCKFILC